MVLSDRDRDLLKRCLTRSEGAWEAFVDRYLALLSHVVTATAKSRLAELPSEIRDDMVAEILLALVDDDFAILRRFRGQSSLGTYLVVVARRIAARRLAKLAPVIQRLQQEPVAEPLDLALESSEEVQALLAKLPENEAMAIRLFHLEHESYGDIGLRLGISENSVGPLLSKARASLKSMRDH